MSEVKNTIVNAGKLLKERYFQSFSYNEKGKHDLVSEVDLEIEELLISKLKSIYPESSLYSEEFGEMTSSGSLRWIIDPVDGTANFIFGVPYFNISLSLEVDKHIVEAYIYNPMTDELYYTDQTDDFSYLKYPEAHGVLIDISEHMIEAAQEKLNDYKDNLEFIVFDYCNKDWIQKVKRKVPYDIIVSGLSIHHQPDVRKKEIYSEIYELLSPGGIFINLEHVLSPTKWVSSLFNDCFIDSLFEMHIKKNPAVTREQIAAELYNRPDKEANVLAPVELQCDWLREIGFMDVDCYFKIYELAIFGGRKAF